MGFQRKRKLYELDFEGTDLEGLTMVMRGLSVEEYLELTTLKEVAEASEERQEAELRGLFEKVAQKIERWNLEDDDGNSVPPSAKELLSWDFSDAMMALNAWMSKVQGVSAPLDQPSASGKKWVGEPIPMDIPSPNLTNS